jgi:hypothetical protein
VQPAVGADLGRVVDWYEVPGGYMFPADVAGFDAFIQRYIAALPVERAAVEHG